MASTDTFMLQLRGEIDLARSGELTALIDDYDRTTARHVIIDLSEVTFCDSQGLTFLVQMNSIARERDGDVTLVNPPETVQNLLRITRLDDRFRYEDRVFLP
jgi:anti-sigma B factor antagonist